MAVVLVLWCGGTDDGSGVGLVVWWQYCWQWCWYCGVVVVLMAVVMVLWCGCSADGSGDGVVLWWRC